MRTRMNPQFQLQLSEDDEFQQRKLLLLRPRRKKPLWRKQRRKRSLLPRRRLAVDVPARCRLFLLSQLGLRLKEYPLRFPRKEDGFYECFYECFYFLLTIGSAWI